jgi:hypothetical protein
MVFGTWYKLRNQNKKKQFMYLILNTAHFGKFKKLFSN